MGRDLSSAPVPAEPRALALVERGLWAGLLLSVAVAGLLAGRNALAPAQHPWTFGLAFWALLAAAYLPLGLALGLVAALAQRLFTWGTGRLLVLAGGVLAVATLLGSNPRAVRLALAVQAEPARFRFLVPAAMVLATAAVGLLGLRRSGPLRATGLLAAASLATGLWPAAPPAARALAAAAEQTRPGPVSVLPPLIVIGLDGADWRYAEPLMERGDLPNLARLRESGAWGPLATMQPTLSPIIWTSIATGQPAHLHGVDGFVQPRLRGVDEPLPDLHLPRRSGLRRLFQGLKDRGLVRDLPITSQARRLPAIWNLAAQAGAPVALVGWWVTWPAEPVYGYVVSERAYYYGGRPAAGGGERLTWPPGLYRDLAGEVQRYDQVPLEQARRFVSVEAGDWAAALRYGRADARDALAELPYFLSLFETNRRHALALMARGRTEFGRVPDLMVLFRLIDQTCHTSLHHSELVVEHLDSSARAQAAFGRSVTEAYRQADAVVGELTEACGSGCNVLVLSDHGFELQDFPGGLHLYHHTRGAPPGIFLASGPAFQPGRVDDLGVLDVMPLMAYLEGLPLADDLKGRLPVEVLRAELLAAQPARRVASYGTRARPEALDSAAADVDAAMLERLRALGYID